MSIRAYTTNIATPQPLFQDATTVDTTVTMGVHALTVALVFKAMQDETGRAMLQEIVAKTLPEGVDIMEGAVLERVHGHDDRVEFTFSAKQKMLTRSNLLQTFHVAQSFSFTPKEIAQKVIAEKYSSNLLNTNLFNIDATSPVAVQIPPYPITTAPGTGTYTIPSTTVLPYTYRPQEVTPVANTQAPACTDKAETFLHGPKTGAASDTHIIYRTMLDTYHVFEADNWGDNKDFPGEKLYTASNWDDLQEFFAGIQREREDAEIQGTSLPQLHGTLKDKVWHAVQY